MAGMIQLDSQTGLLMNTYDYFKDKYIEYNTDVSLYDKGLVDLPAAS